MYQLRKCFLLFSFSLSTLSAQHGSRMTDSVVHTFGCFACILAECRGVVRLGGRVRTLRAKRSSRCRHSPSSGGAAHTSVRSRAHLVGRRPPLVASRTPCGVKRTYEGTVPTSVASHAHSAERRTPVGAACTADDTAWTPGGVAHTPAARRAALTHLTATS